MSGAYRRFDLLDRRAVLMRDWTKFVAGAVRDDAALGPDSREEGESMTREPFPEPSHKCEVAIDALVGIALVAAAMFQVDDEELTRTTSWQRAASMG